MSDVTWDHPIPEIGIKGRFDFHLFASSLCRADCNESCKLRKQVLENECKQLRRELSTIDELKKSAEQQSRNYEQEVRASDLHLVPESIFDFVWFRSCANSRLNFEHVNRARAPKYWCLLCKRCKIRIPHWRKIYRPRRESSWTYSRLSVKPNVSWRLEKVSEPQDRRHQHQYQSVNTKYHFLLFKLISRCNSPERQRGARAESENRSIVCCHAFGSERLIHGPMLDSRQFNLTFERWIASGASFTNVARTHEFGRLTADESIAESVRVYLNGIVHIATKYNN